MLDTQDFWSDAPPQEKENHGVMAIRSSAHVLGAAEWMVDDGIPSRAEAHAKADQLNRKAEACLYFLPILITENSSA